MKPDQSHTLFFKLATNNSFISKKTTQKTILYTTEDFKECGCFDSNFELKSQTDVYCERQMDRFETNDRECDALVLQLDPWIPAKETEQKLLTIA